jgi:hypothetical protein
LFSSFHVQIFSRSAEVDRNLISLLHLPSFSLGAAPPAFQPVIQYPLGGFQGQAVWGRAYTPRAAKFGCKRANGQAWRSSKNPFPIMELHRSPAGWQLLVSFENRRFSGRGTPPERLILWQLLRAISSEPLGKDWSWVQQGGDITRPGAAIAARRSREQVPAQQLDIPFDANLPWRLVNARTGEALEGSFSHGTHVPCSIRPLALAFVGRSSRHWADAFAV